MTGMPEKKTPKTDKPATVDQAKQALQRSLDRQDNGGSAR